MPVFQWVDYFADFTGLCQADEDPEHAMRSSLPSYLPPGVSGEDGARSYPLTIAALLWYCHSRGFNSDQKRPLLSTFFSTTATKVGLSDSNPSGAGVVTSTTAHVFPTEVFGQGDVLEQYIRWVEALKVPPPARFEPLRLDKRHNQRRHSTTRCVGEKEVRYVCLP